jgi:hypothetical protein
MAGCWAAAALAGGLRPGAAQAADRPRISVSVANLGVTGGKLDAAELVGILKEADWCEPEAGPPDAAWNVPPSGVNRSEWLSVTVVGFGERAEAAAWLFDGPNGSGRRVARVPYGMTVVYGGRKIWRVPVPRLAQAIRAGWQKFGADPDPRPVATMRVAELSGAETAEGAAGSGKTSSLQTGDGAAVSIREGLPPVEALAWAAAWDSGLAPAREGGAANLLVEASFTYQALTARATLERNGGRMSMLKTGLPEEQIEAGLVRMMIRLQHPDRFSDFAYLGPRPLPLAALPDRLVALVDGMPLGWDPHTGQPVWPDKENRRAMRLAARSDFTSRLGLDGMPVLFRHTRSVAQVNLRTGAETERLPAGTGDGWAFDVAADGTGVRAEGARLMAYKAGAELWSAEEPAAIRAGPILAGGLAISGNDRGEVAARDAADGRERWRTLTAPGLRGPMALLGGRVAAYAAETGELVALDPADGRAVWRLALGDMPLQPPMEWAGLALVVSKNNRLLVVRPADGTIAAEKTWPTWLVSVMPVAFGSRPGLCCADLEGRVTWLEGPDLRVIRETLLPARPVGGVAAASFPASWGGAGEWDRDLRGLASGEGPAAVVTDREGFAFIMPVSAKE